MTSIDGRLLHQKNKHSDIRRPQSRVHRATSRDAAFVLPGGGTMLDAQLEAVTRRVCAALEASLSSRTGGQ
jgi:hypothetical protein